MHAGEIGGHQLARERLVRAPALGHQLEAEFDEQGARGYHPELRLAAPVVRHQGFGGGPELALAAALVEQAPGRAPGVERVEDDVAAGVVEVLDERAGEIEDDAAL